MFEAHVNLSKFHQQVFPWAYVYFISYQRYLKIFFIIFFFLLCVLCVFLHSVSSYIKQYILCTNNTRFRACHEKSHDRSHWGWGYKMISRVFFYIVHTKLPRDRQTMKHKNTWKVMYINLKLFTQYNLFNMNIIFFLYVT